MKKSVFLAVLFFSFLSVLSADPSTGNAICPVSHDSANPKHTLEHEGQTYAFCCKKCMKEFKKNPSKYIAAEPQEVIASDELPVEQPSLNEEAAGAEEVELPEIAGEETQDEGLSEEHDHSGHDHSHSAP